MDEKISVIVPVYRVEQYLEECIKSIIEQTYSNIEIIIVDDGSPDCCPQMCDEFAKQDSRIRVIHKENGGVSSARNVGIEVATGKYITFIDSDDYVDKDYLLKLYNNLNGCSISECGIICFDDTGLRSINYKLPIILSWEEYLTEVNLNGFLSYAIVCAKLYLRELFVEVRFPLGRINGEDEATTFKLVYTGKKVSRIYEGLYFYRQRENGASKTKVTDKRIKDCDDLFNEKINFFKDKDRDDLVAFFSAKKAIAFIGLYNSSEKRKQKKICDKIIKELFGVFRFRRNVPLKYKLYTVMHILKHPLNMRRGN